MRLHSEEQHQKVIESMEENHRKIVRLKQFHMYIGGITEIS